MNSPWLSKRMARGLGSASISMRIVCAVVVRPMFDFERATADTQGGIGAENEDAGRCASAVLPGRQFLFARD